MRENYHLIGLNARIPSAVLGGLRADTDPKTMLRQLSAAQTEHNARHQRELDNVQAVLDDMNGRLAAIGLSGVGALGGVPVDPAYTTSFSSYFRTGAASAEGELKAAHQSGSRSRISAAMSTGSASDGGFLAPVEWDRKVNSALRPLSPMRTICTVQPSSVGSFTTLWSDSAVGSGWVGESAARPNTTTPQLTPITFSAGEIYANPALTQQLLDDADFDVAAWLGERLALTFALQEGVAFINGNGVNKPYGLLNFAEGGNLTHPGGQIPVRPSGQAANITTDGIVDLVYSLPAPYRSGASFLMNSTTLARVRKFKDAGGQYLWQAAFELGQPQTILGYPVYCDENMPDVAAGALSIAFGDFKRGYLINDRAQVRILRDPYSLKPYVQFYTTKRVGGGVLDPRALIFMRIGA